MSLPPLAPVPSVKLRLELAPPEWEACIKAWASLSELYLRLPDESFARVATSPGILDMYLLSFFRESASLGSSETRLNNDSIYQLKKSAFLLVHRIFGSQVSPTLMHWEFFADLSHAYPHSESLRTLLKSFFERHGPSMEMSLHKIKSILITKLESERPEAAGPDMRRIIHLFRASPDAAAFFMVGSDFVDALTSAYDKASLDTRPCLVVTLYLGLSGLLHSSKPNFSILSDHLYSLRTHTEAAQKASKTANTLLVNLVTNTAFIHVMGKQTSSEATRARNTAASLSVFQQPSLRRPRRRPKPKVDKGKSREEPSTSEMHMHRMSLITQIQDLFPDLGTGFVAKLLNEYNENVEEVIAHLLEESLPAHLKSADRTEELNDIATQLQKSDLAPRSTPPAPEPTIPVRRNIYDDDEFDRLAVDVSKLHFGRKDKGTADDLLSNRESAPNKAAIISALAAFDSDDDERDDTYDAEDVGGTVEPGAEEADSGNEEVLFKAYTSTPQVFSRDALTRRSKERDGLRISTNMTDESIEGWAVMLARDPRKIKKLEAKYTSFTGQQRDLTPQSWTKTEETDDSDGRHASDRTRGGRGGFRGGRGRGRGGRGGPQGGSEASTRSDGQRGGAQQNRARKEANKSSRANHSRREQRAKKMARGGFAG
ncbi:hypothetical protein EJ05DRAFT_476463 [Pseudovirgaria hyperparasitica]|uniref:CUE domain-containing protein n=1 Tax=Pseudovirgaria hyperparasitica TaxID=470096 RepID=A0A6A6W5P5_9PEZI|nr:uncharacterized protein EJ05DRAFT_476463 [Pseudovirgaria hyperparasitica]KAF2758202.1 hypothetical protein EJ05DRAFT_476463 [Pseudovirgaria hyperparasitica]